MPRTSVSWTCIRSRNLPRRGKLGSEWVVRVEQAVPFRTGRFECDRAEGSVDLAIELEAIHQGSSWQRQTRIEGGGHFALTRTFGSSAIFPKLVSDARTHPLSVHNVPRGFLAVEVQFPEIFAGPAVQFDRPEAQALLQRRVMPFSFSNSSKEIVGPGSLKLRSDMMRSASSSLMKFGSLKSFRSAGLRLATNSFISSGPGVSRSTFLW